METELGWVLSGPMKCKSNNDIVSTQVNLITSVLDQTFESEVHKLWDLETLGINPLKDEVHEEFREGISFDRSRYSVKSPSKEGHPELSTNYSTSLRRLKSQVARLEKEPEALREYASIINDQLDSGVIKRCNRESGRIGKGGESALVTSPSCYSERSQNNQGKNCLRYLLEKKKVWNV